MRVLSAASMNPHLNPTFCKCYCSSLDQITMYPHAPSSKVAKLSVVEATAAWRPTTNGALLLTAAAAVAGGADAGADFAFPFFLLLVPSIAMLRRGRIA